MRALRTAVFALALAAYAAALAGAPSASALDPAKLLDLDTLSCDAVALGGNTLRCTLTAPENLAGQSLRVRLWGVAVPGMRDIAGWGGRAALDDLLAASPSVACRPKVRQHDQVVAACHTQAGQDLAEAVIATGWATEHRAATREGPGADAALAARYAAAEREARVKELGTWRQATPASPPDTETELAIWRDWGPALIQAVLSAAAVLFATVWAARLSRRFGMELHKETIEREESERLRQARSHLYKDYLRDYKLDRACYKAVHDIDSYSAVLTEINAALEKDLVPLPRGPLTDAAMSTTYAKLPTFPNEAALPYLKTQEIAALNSAAAAINACWVRLFDMPAKASFINEWIRAAVNSPQDSERAEKEVRELTPALINDLATEKANLENAYKLLLAARDLLGFERPPATLAEEE